MTGAAMTIKKSVSLLLAFLLIFSFGFRKLNVRAEYETTVPESSVTSNEETTTEPNSYDTVVTGNKLIDFFLNMLLAFSEIIYAITESISGALTEEPTTLPPTTAESTTVTEPTTQAEDEFSMMWPMGGETYITAGYPAYSNGDPHYGIDISNPTGASYGQNIYAAESGEVIRAYNDGNWNGGFGNYVEIDHGNGIRTLYAHASEVLVTVGQTVEKGDVIGKVGNTGNTTAAHLHFEVKEVGADGSITRVDPLKYVTQP
ncbi:MAG: M23 family metallopeptidase [Clostridia bacterium]|nr:M23 family metallopeptidase [Clostridia bacterium]